MASGLLWIPATLVASAAQTARNAAQRHLTERIGTVGATGVRFLYGLPFAALFLLLVVLATGARPPAPNPRFVAFVLAGALAQVLATGLMLAAMRGRSFAVVTALIKTEPVQVALFGLAVLGDHLTPMAGLGIGVATLGVLLASGRVRGRDAADPRPVVFGLVAGACFAASAIGFRGAILALGPAAGAAAGVAEDAAAGVLAASLVPATTTLVYGLAGQTLVIALWLLAFDRPVLAATLRAWRPSLGAGFLGAFASQFWFLGFALTAAANVRTLALVEVLMAGFVSHRLGQSPGGRELAGIALMLAGLAALLAPAL